MYRGGLFGPFRSVGTLKVLFSCLRLHRPFCPRCFPHSCSVVGASTVSNSEGGLLRSLTLATLRFCSRSAGALLPSLVSRWLRFDGCDATLCCVWCGSTLTTSCRHVRFQPLWFFAALLCGDALTATERVLECHRVGNAGWVFNALEGCDGDVDASWYDLGS